MKNKSIYNIIFYTILVFCISIFSYFPESYSKYIKDEIEDKSPVRYHVDLESLRINDLILAFNDTSTYEKVDYIFEFNKSNLWKDGDTNQKITIKVEQDVCKITDVKSTINAEINNNIATINYNNSLDDKITVIYNCNVSDITVNENGEKYIYSNIYIYDKYNSENTYLYTKAKENGMKVLLSKYYESFPIPNEAIKTEGTKIIIPDSVSKKDAKNGFDSWIKKYYKDFTDEYKSAVHSYVNSVYTSENDMLNSNKVLEGITYTYDPVEGNHIYQIDNDFLGYARTYFARSLSDDLTRIMFSNNSLDDAGYNRIFRYYFETYGNYEEEELEKIMDYITNFGSVKHIMTKNGNGEYNVINGLTYDPEKDEIRISLPFMDYVNIFYNKKIEIAFSNSMSMYIVLRNSLKTVYGDLLSDELYNSMLGTTLMQSISKNATDATETPKAYTDYFTYKDPTNNNYILLIISSDGKEKTTAEIIDLGIVDTLVTTQVVNETENKLNISITHDNTDINESKTVITEIIRKIDVYFGTNYKDEITDELFTTSTETERITSIIDGTNVTILYTITK